MHSSWVLADQTKPSPKVSVGDVIKAADAAIKAKQEALDVANEAVEQQSKIIQGQAKEVESAESKLNTLPHNTYAMGGIGVGGGILLASGAVIPGVGVLLGIVIIGLFK